MKTRFLLTLALAVCMTLACTDKNPETQQTEPTWGIASLNIDRPIAAGDTLCYHIEMNLDTLSAGDPLAQSIARVICDSVLRMTGFSSVQKAMTVYADTMETEWKEWIAEAYNPQSEWRETLQYTYTLDGHPIENGCDSILSYQTTLDCYLGGAHGSYVIMYYNFDRSTGKLLNIRDLVPADKEAEVIKAMEAQLCQDWEAKDMTDLKEKTGITAMGDLYLSNNFTLKGDSITFLFNQYDIAPYAAGLIGITVKAPTPAE